MTDPAGITQRGAEQSAPRSRSGLSGADLHRVSRSRAHLVSSHAREQSFASLDRQPPDARRQLERRLAIAKRAANDLLSGGARCAVEGGAKARARVGSSLRRVGRVGAQLRAERGGVAPSAIARLTSTGCHSDARHVRVVSLPVLHAAAIAAGEASRLPVKRVACLLKSRVE